MTEAQMNALAAADPLFFVRHARAFMALCLKHYEDVLRAQHAALLARSRANPEQFAYAYANPLFYGGRDFMGNNPLFWDGGPPRHYGAVGDIGERDHLFNALEGSVYRAYWRSSAYPKLRSLHRRMWVFHLADGYSPWQQIREIYRTFDMYASGASERAEVLGSALSGGALTTPGLGSRLNSMREPGPLGSGRRTWPGPGPGPEEIGHARTDVGGRTPGPVGIADTIEDLLYSSTLPGPPRRTTGPPVACERMVETTAVEAGGASGAGGRLIVPMTIQQRDGIYRMDTALGSQENPNPGFPGSNFYQGRGGYEYYVSDWRTQGGVGPPPEFGFLIMGPDGSVARTVGYYAQGLGR
jgi:hypothetical protein